MVALIENITSLCFAFVPPRIGLKTICQRRNRLLKLRCRPLSKVIGEAAQKSGMGSVMLLLPADKKMLPRWYNSKHIIPNTWQVGFTQRGSRLTWTQDVLASPQGGWRSQTTLRSLGTTCCKERWLLAILSLHITWNETISQSGYVGTRLMIPFTGGETSQGTQERADHVESQQSIWILGLRFEGSDPKSQPFRQVPMLMLTDWD